LTDNQQIFGFLKNSKQPLFSRDDLSVYLIPAGKYL